MQKMVINMTKMQMGKEKPTKVAIYFYWQKPKHFRLVEEMK